MRTRMFVSVTLMLSFGCASKEESASNGDIDSSEGPTWHQDVRPIVESSCVSCHQEGAIGTFLLEDYDDALLVKNQIADAVEHRRMPPWKAVEGCNEYRADISLSQEDIDTVVAWADAGAPEGDPETARTGSPPELGGLDRVDLTLELPLPYTPNADANDDYRCFPVKWPVEEEVFVTGYEVKPGNTDLLHHVIAYIAPESYEEALLAEEALDGRPGFECFGGPGPVDAIDSEWMGGWAPGASQGPMPNGVGIRMQPGSWLVLQMHYNLSDGEITEDDTTIDVMLDTEVEREGWIQPFTNPSWVIGGGMDIPAQTDGVTHGFAHQMPRELMIHTTNLHMHNLGKEARMQLSRTDGSEVCLLEINDWDFDWQRTYVLEEPVTINAGDEWSLDCMWDNPTDQDVDWGEGTGDEMCLGTALMSLP